MPVTAGRSFKQRLLRVEPAICRLLVCAGASLALHALALGARGPADTSATYDGHANTPVIQAALMSSRLSPASTPSLSSDAHREHAAAQSHVRQQANRPHVNLRRSEDKLARTYAGDRASASVAYPVPDKWHTAEEVDVRAEPLTPVNLVYPEQSASRIRGRVRIALFIDERGWVRKAQVLASEPEHLFDDVALRAWQDVRFAPALKGDVPVKSEKLLEMDFTPY
jgi:TonB family protein